MAEVRDNPERDRYEIVVDGQVAGFAQYAQRPGRIFFVHTEIDPAYEGQGLGSALAAGALSDARARGLRVVPLCRFIASYLDRHPQYSDVVDHDLMVTIDPDA